MNKKEGLNPESIKHSCDIKNIADLLNGNLKIFIIDKLYYTEKIKFMDLKKTAGNCPKSIFKRIKRCRNEYLVKQTESNDPLVSIEYELTDFEKRLHNIIDIMGKWVLKIETDY